MSDAQGTGKVAIVTGAGRGIGRAIAGSLAAAGYTVALAARSVEAQGAAEELRAEGLQARAWQVDVADVAATASFVDDVASSLGRLDVLVNNAGVNRAGWLAEARPADFDAMFATNVRGPLFAMQAAVPHMVAQGGGRVVNLASWVGRTPAPGFLAYSASKAALVSLTRGAALELATSGVTVNAVSPGNVWTDTWTSSTEGTSFGSESPRDIFERSVAAQPIPRGVDAEEIAAAVLYLCSDAARSITGETLVVASGL